MKKILITIMAIVFIFSVTTPAIAKGAKVPKDMCFIASGAQVVFYLGIKKGNKVMMKDAKYDFYTIQGIIEFFMEPLPGMGTGYMNGDEFVFHMSSSLDNDFAATGVWDVVTETGSVTINVIDGLGLTSTEYDLIPCVFRN